jgi:glycerate kinase
VLVEEAKVAQQGIHRAARSLFGPQSGACKASISRLAARLAATSRGADAVPLAHQSVHSPEYSGASGPMTSSILAMASATVVSRKAGIRPSLFQLATKAAMGGNGGSLSNRHWLVREIVRIGCR